jgi:hypothetical protein
MIWVGSFQSLQRRYAHLRNGLWTKFLSNAGERKSIFGRSWEINTKQIPSPSRSGWCGDVLGDLGQASELFRVRLTLAAPYP